MLRSLPERFKVDIKVKEGTHQSENAGAFYVSCSLRDAAGIAHDLFATVGRAVNKQLNDKERVAGKLVTLPVAAIRSTRGRERQSLTLTSRLCSCFARQPRAAALENNHLLSVVQQCLSTADQRAGAIKA